MSPAKKCYIIIIIWALVVFIDFLWNVNTEACTMEWKRKWRVHRLRNTDKWHQSTCCYRNIVVHCCTPTFTLEIANCILFINDLSADVKSNLVIEATRHLHQVNVRVTSIICDGWSTNFSVSSNLGASLTAQKIQTFSSIQIMKIGKCIWCLMLHTC